MLTAGSGWLAVGAKVAVGASVGAEVGAPELELLIGADEGAEVGAGAGGIAGAGTASM